MFVLPFGDYMDYMPEPDLDIGHDGNQDSMPEPDLNLGHNNVDFNSTPSDKMVDATNTDPVQVPKPPTVAAGLWRFLGSIISQQVINPV